jgi:uncharacterized protein YndB with AHSA1/START domain
MSRPATTLQITTPSDREIVMTRAFDAPRELVFEAWTDPRHVREWWGGRDATILACEADVRPGGTWRYVTTSGDGTAVPFNGVYREVTPPERLVYTEMYDVEPFNQGDPAVNTVTFAERGGTTLMTCVTVYPSKDVRDAVIQSGMESGAVASMDCLAELLATLS